MAVDAGIKLGVEGESTFKSAMAAANAEIKAMAQGIKEAASGTDDYSRKQEALTKYIQANEEKLGLLAKQYDAAKDKLSSLAKVMEEAKEAGDDEAITKATNAYNKQAAEVSKLEEQMSKCRTEISDSAKAMDDMGTSSEEASEKSSKFKDTLAEIGTSLKNFAKEAAGAAMEALKELGSALVDVGKSAMDSYKDYEQLTGGIETLFKESSDQVMQYANDAYKAAGMSANEYMETVQGFAAAMVQSTGKAAQQNIDVLKESLDKEYQETKRSYEDQATALKRSWEDRIKIATENKDKNVDLLRRQRDDELTELKRTSEDKLSELKAFHSKQIAEAKAANDASVTTAETLAEAADLSNQAIIDMSDNANKMGTSIESISKAYQGFAKQNFTMLDNLKLGYGGTKEEMQRLIDHANELKKAQGELGDLSINSFADITEAIHLVQEEMGITGTTAKEAGSTIEGSVKSMQSAWKNLTTGIADENANIEQLVGNFVDSISTAGENIVPRIGQIIDGISKAIEEFVRTGLPKLLEQIPGRQLAVTCDYNSIGKIQYLLPFDDHISICKICIRIGCIQGESLYPARNRITLCIFQNNRIILV